MNLYNAGRGFGNERNNRLDSMGNNLDFQFGKSIRVQGFYSSFDSHRVPWAFVNFLAHLRE